MSINKATYKGIDLFYIYSLGCLGAKVSIQTFDE